MNEDRKEVIDRDFKDELLHNLNKFRRSNILCDIIVRPEGHDFPRSIDVFYLRKALTSGLTLQVSSSKTRAMS